MRRAALAWVYVAAPALGGCNMAYYAAHNLVNEPLVVCQEHWLDKKLRKEGKATLAIFERTTPGKTYTTEFRDGFLDGYVDYLAYGGNAAPAAVAPPEYTRSKRYIGPDGQARLDDYFRGFECGVATAVASGHRPTLLTKVGVPVVDSEPPRFNLQRPVSPASPAPANWDREPASVSQPEQSHLSANPRPPVPALPADEPGSPRFNPQQPPAYARPALEREPVAVPRTGPSGR